MQKVSQVCHPYQIGDDSRDDVRNWIVDVEKELLDKIQDGPVVIS